MPGLLQHGAGGIGAQVPNGQAFGAAGRQPSAIARKSCVNSPATKVLVKLAVDRGLLEGMQLQTHLRPARDRALFSVRAELHLVTVEPNRERSPQCLRVP